MDIENMVFDQVRADVIMDAFVTFKVLREFSYILVRVCFCFYNLRLRSS